MAEAQAFGDMGTRDVNLDVRHLRTLRRPGILDLPMDHTERVASPEAQFYEALRSKHTKPHFSMRFSCLDTRGEFPMLNAHVT